MTAMTEEEKRRHRCCFAGQRAEKLDGTERELREWLSGRIDEAIADGYTTFICGMSMGADLWAGELVTEKKAEHPELRLIAAAPYPAFAARWNEEWRGRYERLMALADHRTVACKAYQPDAFQKRSEWMVDHAGRLIACCGSEKGGAAETVAYARQKGIQIVEWFPEEDAASQAPYPLNLLRHALPEEALPEDAALRVLIAMSRSLKTEELSLLEKRYRDGLTPEALGGENGPGADKIRQLIRRAEGRLCHREFRGFLLNEKEEEPNDRRLQMEWLLGQLRDP